MSNRFVVINARPLARNNGSEGVHQNHYKARGFLVLDKEENKRLPDVFMARSEAQEECDRRNGR